MYLIIFAIFILSAATLGYEILLLRLFSIVLWHNYAYIIISIALLGIGASGTFLFFTRRWLEKHFTVTFITFAIAFSFLSIICFSIAQRIPFNPLEFIWNLEQQKFLIQIYIILSLPFFCSSTPICLALIHFKKRLNLIYFADLVGAGCGALFILLILSLFDTTNSLRIIAFLGYIASLLVIFSIKRINWIWILVLLILPINFFLLPESWLRPIPLPYKALNKALNVPKANIITEYSSPLAQVTVVESPLVPFRHAPGLSLNAQLGPEEQLGIFIDADSFTPITKFNGDLESINYLDKQPHALPFYLLEKPKILVLGMGGGSDVLRSFYFGAPVIDAVELNPQIVKIVTKDQKNYTNNFFSQSNIRIHTKEARSFIRGQKETWDIIQLSLFDSLTAANAGVFALKENNLYTVEAFRDYMGHLNPGGFLTITRWLKVPPKDSLKLLATAVSALESDSKIIPHQQIVFIRSWNTTTLLIKNGKFTENEIKKIKSFTEERSFDLVFYPGISVEETNKFNRLDEPYFYLAAISLLNKDKEKFFKNYKFYLKPATDDKPYFYRFFKWKLLPEVLSMKGKAPLVLLEGGYLIQVATLILGSIVSAILILLPLFWLKGKKKNTRMIGYFITYFFSLGLGFLFIEIAFMQHFILFLGHPLYSISIVITSFLVFAGLGSICSFYLLDRFQFSLLKTVFLAILFIIILSSFYLLTFTKIFNLFMPYPIFLKILISMILISPLAFFMGIPFPLGLRLVSNKSRNFIPWAWGINGYASVLSPLLASLLATHIGFKFIVIISLGLYFLACLSFKNLFKT